MSVTRRADALRSLYGRMRFISFSMTIEQCRARTKTETRRTGWLGETAGTRLLAVSKVMGFRKGERIDDIAELFGAIELVEVRREPLNAITPDAVEREGFPGWTPDDFVRFFLSKRRDYGADSLVTVMRFRWLDG